MIDILAAITANTEEIESRLTDSLSRSGSKPMLGDLDMDGFNILNCPSITGGGSGGRISVKDFGATGDGVTNDSSAINAAIFSVYSSGGGVLYFPTGQYILGSTIVLKSRVILEGEGFSRTILRGQPGTSHNLLETDGYFSLIGTNTPGGPIAFGLRNLSIDGNKSARSGGGSCLRIYGYDYELTNVEIYRAPGVGFYSEWCTSGNVPVTPFGKDTMESHITGLRIFQCGSDGMSFYGPHDSIFRDILTYINSGRGAVFGQNANSTAGGCMVDQLHSYGNSSWGIVTYTMLFGGLIESESNTSGGGIQINIPDGRIQGGTLIGWGNTGVGVEFNANSNAVSVISNNNTGTGVNLFSSKNRISISSFSNGGDGLVYGSSSSTNVINGCNTYSNSGKGVYLQGSDNILMGLSCSSNAGGGVQIANGVNGVRIDGECTSNTGTQIDFGTLGTPAIIDLMVYTAAGQTAWGGNSGNNFIRVAARGSDIRPISKAQT